MTSPTPNKGYTYPAHGGAVGAWDTPLNTNFDQIDLNVGGAYPITILTTAVGATYNTSGATISSTVATVTFPSSLAQNLYYNFTGTQTQNVTFTYPAAGGIYVVGNNSSGAFSLTASVGTATTIAVTQGGQSIVVTDTAGAYAAQNAFSNITVNSITVSSMAMATGTGSWTMPSGTTVQRSSLGIARFRYNTDLKQPEVSDGNNWRQIPVGQPIAAGYRNLKIQNSATANPDTQVNITADAVTVESTAGTAYRLTSFNLTPVSSVNGANGLDTGGLANNTWYGIYVIYSSTGNTTAGLISAAFSSSSVTMPAGYDAQARFGAILTTGSAHFHRTLQYGNVAQYVVTTGSTTANYPIMISGNSGNITAPVWTAVAWTGYAPPTVSELDLLLGMHGTGTSDYGLMASPNNAASTYASVTNPPQLLLAFGNSGATINVQTQTKARFTVESSNVYYAATLGAASGFLAITGWVDNI